MLGTYFFYSTEKMQHYRIARTILNVFEDFGGMNELILIVMASITFYFSTDFKNVKMLQKLYFEKSDSFLLSENIHFCRKDKCTLCLSKLFPCRRKQKNTNKTLAIFEKGTEMVETDLNIVRIIRN